MKLSRKLLPALAMLIVSAVLLTTSSFAWFALNTNATAQNMTVKLNTDNQYLLVYGWKSTDTAIKNSAVQTSSQTTATGEIMNGADTLKPVAHSTILTVSSAEVEKTSNWFTAVGTSVSDGTASGSSTTFLESSQASLNSYVAKYTYSVAMAAGSDDGGELTVSGLTVTVAPNQDSAKTKVQPVSVILVCGSNLVEYKYNATETAGWKVVGTGSKLADSVGSTAAEDALRIDVYIYYDGANTVVTTNNQPNLANAIVSFTLNVGDTPAVAETNE